jgi:hypothetical protein
LRVEIIYWEIALPDFDSTVRFFFFQKLSASPSNSYETGVSGNRRIERDKSSKRKSNLNRALNSEEVPTWDAGKFSPQARTSSGFMLICLR